MRRLFKRVRSFANGTALDGFCNDNFPAIGAGQNEPKISRLAGCHYSTLSGAILTLQRNSQRKYQNDSRISWCSKETYEGAVR